MSSLQSELTERRGRVKLRLWSGAHARSFILDTRPPFAIGPLGARRVDRRRWWLLRPRLPPVERLNQDRHELISECFRWAQEHAPRQLELALDVLTGFNAAAWRACTPDARRIALKVHARARFDVYKLIAGDETGRIGQLATSCPGALLMLAALSTVPDNLGTFARLRHDVVSGRRLNHALRDHYASRGSPSSGEGEPLDVERWLPFRRRAPLSVRPWSLLLLPCAAVSLDAMPRTESALADCYAAVTLRFDWSRLPADADFRRGLSEFMARHGFEVLRRLRRHRMGSTTFARCVHRSGLRPGLASSPARVLAAAFAEADREGEELKECLGLDNPFPASPVPPLAALHATLRPLARPSELIRASRVMANCAASYLRDAVQGTAALFAGTAHGRRLMVGFALEPDGSWRLSGLKGSTNRDPTAAEVRIVKRWLATAAPGVSLGPLRTPRGHPD